MRYRTKETFEEIKLESKKRKLFAQILDTPPVSISKTTDVQIISLTSKEDFPMLILALKSLIILSGQQFDVLILDDGTLDTHSIKLLRNHLHGVSVVSTQAMDKKIGKSFKRNKEIISKSKSPYIRKKIGTLLFAKKKKLLLLDSDILFFRKPEEIIDWARGKFDCIYLQDVKDSYLISNIESRDLFKLSIYPRVNSGLLGLERSMLDRPILLKLIDVHDKLSVNRPNQFQVYFSILFSKYKKSKKIHTLSKRYVLTEPGKEYPHIICGHFPRGVRALYFDDAQGVVRKLKSKS